MADPPSDHNNDDEPQAVPSVVSEGDAPPEQPQQPWYPPPPQAHPAVAMAQYYEARMRDHAAAYASAAAGAAWAAAQIAASTTLPPTLPPAPQLACYPPQQDVGGGYPPQQELGTGYPPQQQDVGGGYPPQQELGGGYPPPQQPYYHPPPPLVDRPGKRQQTSPGTTRGEKRGRRRMLRSDQSSSDTSRQRKRPSDRSLLGKTAVSALHEWCDKRKLTPTFVSLQQEEHGFSMAVEIEGVERGRGRGGTKVLAKKEAALQALQSLIPGVVLDDNGIVAHLPSDLSRLKIESNKKRQLGTVYPSTTSEEDNDYFASRGASVCSTLLHAMWQIREDIPEPPSYTYDVCAVKRQAPSVHRSSFCCTARLLVESSLEEAKKSEETEESTEATTLTASGTAVTKREARHVASAKLLAMLFPECNGMVEVKAAAEAVREAYAASKALKMQSRRTTTPNNKEGQPRKRSIDFCLPTALDPPLSDYLSEQLRSILGQQESTTAAAEDEVSVESLSLSEKVQAPKDAKNFDSEESLSRCLGRKKQLDERVDAALTTLNELDDEGRSLPEELNSNHVGYTVLRRAEMEDAVWIEKLLSHQDSIPKTSWQSGPFALMADKQQHQQSSSSSSSSLRLWGSTSITLLLCRAISPKDDPPLGCAVLTLGFSMEKGPTLRIAELVSEPHLPKERFIECLDKFAHHMNCILESQTAKEKPSETVFSPEQLKAILEAHLKCTKEESSTGETGAAQDGILDLKTIGASLQSVQEEEPEVEEDKKTDTKDDRRAAKRDKPCKRSRVI